MKFIELTKRFPTEKILFNLDQIKEIISAENGVGTIIRLIAYEKNKNMLGSFFHVDESYEEIKTLLKAN